jgi:hypothetical protein
VAPGDEEPSVGDLVERLIDDGRAYAEAEVNLARARIEQRVASYRTAAIFGGSAVAAALVALICFAVTLVLALASLIGPLAGGLAATLLVAALAGGLFYVASDKWRKAGD